jgi:hypothetical protein
VFFFKFQTKSPLDGIIYPTSIKQTLAQSHLSTTRTYNILDNHNSNLARSEHFLLKENHNNLSKNETNRSSSIENRNNDTIINEEKDFDTKLNME